MSGRLKNHTLKAAPWAARPRITYVSPPGQLPKRE